MRVVVLVAVAGCYGPRVAPGSPCGPGEPCPDELMCSDVTHQCVATLIDGAVMDGTAGSDGSMVVDDARPDTPPGTACYGTGLVEVCFPAPPSGIVHLAGSFSSSTAAMCNVIDGNCVVAGDEVVVGSLIVTGSRPLVLVGVSSISVQNLLDASSDGTGTGGPGANPVADCRPPTAPLHRGGGAGGTFGGAGGNGGMDLNGPDGGIATMPGSLTHLRGGCSGAAGAGDLPLPGGTGGGAVYLISSGSISINGRINASGGGGPGGASATGGSGGGTGGMIGLDAPALNLGAGAIIMANGGGGGEGGSANQTGAPGSNPGLPMIPAPGGTGQTTNAGDGGAGAAGVRLDGMTAGDGTSGGGGGGGAGVIKIYPPQLLGAQVSPPPS